jgi:peptidoglycan/xylan/chitin deacetylase (PgdA/CDA1 family)
MIPGSIPVGMYHHVNDHAGDFITVSVANFQRQMEWLRQEGFETLSAERFLAALHGDYRPARRCFVITFDDAWLDVYLHAFPVLKKYGHYFIIFAVSDLTDTASSQPFVVPPGHRFGSHSEAEKLIAQNRVGEVICSWNHLREMQASGFCSVENHTASHRNAANLAPEALRDDLLRCRNAIKDQLGRDNLHVCWPKGRHNAATLKLARELGFATTYLVRRGVNLRGGRSFAIKRFTVEDRDETWLKKQVRRYSNPLAGYLYSRFKPDRWMNKLNQRSGK